MQLALDSLCGILVLAMVIATYRLMRGPTLADRVVALDVLAILAAAFTGVLSIQWQQRVLLDVTIILALVSFVGTVAFARYIERGTRI